MNSQLKNTNTPTTNSVDKSETRYGGLKQHLCRLISLQVDNLLTSANHQSSVYQIDEAFEAMSDHNKMLLASISHPLV